MAALAFPPHFPPTDRWKKFFIGVRWLGPDLSFFRELKRTQAKRRTDCMSAWGTGIRKELAETMSEVLAQQLGWKSPYFIPEDEVVVVFHGPCFDFTDPESAFEAVLELLQSRFGITRPEEFWRAQDQCTMGALVDSLVGPSDA
jgi:hypothetical protein